MPKTIPKSQSAVMSLARDFAGIGTALFLASVHEVAGVAGIWIAPKIAKSQFGKNFSQGMAMVGVIDRLASRFQTEII